MLWIKAFHIIAIVCWFAGIFYLPRLFVYHAMAEDQATREHLKIMERKLYRFMSPFAVFTLVFGGWLASYNWAYYWQSKWFIAKSVLVVILIIYHGVCGHFVQQLQQDRCQRSHVFYRWFNEVPVLVLFAVVILVVVKPF
ncbi:protoporphyrinogen oxidase HemJ [Oceanicoccus sp. KOV_DT_Chl]|uniref:protoporphyrinogen oxidase HemJ n=1 Tax=Oceanicoccus sp. KOV_DT_Chl TaxID=1904639 RepID=UPI000C7E1579|nr:protoporphyrinogen oxidase HemJ [Oceanicoccus sp. KOV_DT_Chl]